MNQGTKRQPIFKAEEIFKRSCKEFKHDYKKENLAMHAFLFFQIKTTESAGTLRPCIFWHGRNIHNECKEKSSCHVWCMVDIITFLQHHKSFFQFCKLFLAPTYMSVPLFFAPKQMLWQEQWRLSRKCQKTFASIMNMVNMPWWKNGTTIYET